MIRVLLADDHPVVRSGIRAELARHLDLSVVAEATSGDEAFRLALELEPDVLILDINMPGLKAVRVMRNLLATASPTHVLVLTAYSDTETVVGMLKAGATGYVLKDEDPASIAAGVRAAAQGRTWISAVVAAGLALRSPGGGRLPAILSDREREVLALLAQGCSNTQIAEALTLSEGTVKNHVSNIYDHLKVHTRAEAVAWAWQHGLIDGSR